MQPVQMLFQLLFEILQSLPVNSSGSAIGFYLFPSHAQILPRVNFID
jgi:hypothetical protein